MESQWFLAPLPTFGAWNLSMSSRRYLNINQRQLRWLLDGLPLEQRNAHPEVTACTVSPIINFVDPKEEFIKFCRILLFMKTTTNNLNQATQDLQK
jgi:hypothetical protein